VTSDRSVARLFRCLDNPRQLRTNELVAHLFTDSAGGDGDAATLRRIRTALMRGIDAVDPRSGALTRLREKRHAVLLRRCEIDRAPHKRVADELCIGLRQLYRELKSAREAFAEKFRELVAIAPPAPAAAFRLSHLALQRIRSLMDDCRFEEAARAGERFAAGTPDEGDRRDALFALGDAYAEAGKTTELEAFSRSARALGAARLGISARAISARLSAMQARAEFILGDPCTARKILAPNAFAGVDPLADAPEREAWAIALLHSASYHSFSGEHDVTKEHTYLARDIGRGIDGPFSSLLRVRTLCGLVAVHLTGGALDEARTALREAYRLAVECNMTLNVSDIALMYAMADMLTGNAETAIQIERAAVESLERLNAPELPWHLTMAAEIESSCGSTQRAIGLLRKARSAESATTVRRALAETMEAGCLFDAGDYRGARRISAAAIPTFRNRRMLRPLGYGLRIAAEIEEALGNREAMREHISESVELLERFGHPRSYARALECSSRMTGNAEHGRRAAELVAAH
jgi:tetratricopeptide (TPR) repeat protein